MSEPKLVEAPVEVSAAAWRWRKERAQVVRCRHHNADREDNHDRQEEPEADTVSDARHERPLGQLRVLLHNVRPALGDHPQFAQHMPQRHAHRATRARHVQVSVGRRRIPLTWSVCLLQETSVLVPEASFKT